VTSGENAVLSIIIPAYNKEKTIHLILDKVISVVLDNSIVKEIIINDCSTDNTTNAIRAYQLQHKDANIQFYEHDTNKGKGALCIREYVKPRAII